MIARFARGALRAGERLARTLGAERFADELRYLAAVAGWLLDD